MSYDRLDRFMARTATWRDLEDDEFVDVLIKLLRENVPGFEMKSADGEMLSYPGNASPVLDALARAVILLVPESEIDGAMARLEGDDEFDLMP